MSQLQCVFQHCRQRAGKRLCLAKRKCLLANTSRLVNDGTLTVDRLENRQ
jgi:hypothetical protein